MEQPSKLSSVTFEIQNFQRHKSSLEGADIKKASVLRRIIYRGAREFDAEWLQRWILRAGDCVEFRLCRRPWDPEIACGEQCRGIILSTIAEVDDNYAPVYAY